MNLQTTAIKRGFNAPQRSEALLLDAVYHHTQDDLEKLNFFLYRVTLKNDLLSFFKIVFAFNIFKIAIALNIFKIKPHTCKEHVCKFAIELYVQKLEYIQKNQFVSMGPDLRTLISGLFSH